MSVGCENPLRETSILSIPWELMRNERSRVVSRPTQSKSALEQDLEGICALVKVLEAMLKTLRPSPHMRREEVNIDVKDENLIKLDDILFQLMLTIFLS